MSADPDTIAAIDGDPATTDPAAIDLEPYRLRARQMWGEDGPEPLDDICDLIAAVEALWKRVARLGKDYGQAVDKRVARLGKDYGQAVDKFDACRAALARRVEQDTGELPHPPDINTQEWHEWLIEQSDRGADAAQAREIELAGALEGFREHVLKYAKVWEAKGGSHHHPIWQTVAAALASIPADALKRARAKDAVIRYAKVYVSNGGFVGGKEFRAALSALDALPPGGRDNEPVATNGNGAN